MIVQPKNENDVLNFLNLYDFILQHTKEDILKNCRYPLTRIGHFSKYLLCVTQKKASHKG